MGAVVRAAIAGNPGNRAAGYATAARSASGRRLPLWSIATFDVAAVLLAFGAIQLVNGMILGLRQFPESEVALTKDRDLDPFITVIAAMATASGPVDDEPNRVPAVAVALATPDEITMFGAAQPPVGRFGPGLIAPPANAFAPPGGGSSVSGGGVQTPNDPAEPTEPDRPTVPAGPVPPIVPDPPLLADLPVPEPVAEIVEPVVETVKEVADTTTKVVETIVTPTSSQTANASSGGGDSAQASSAQDGSSAQGNVVSSATSSVRSTASATVESVSETSSAVVSGTTQTVGAVVSGLLR